MRRGDQLIKSEAAVSLAIAHRYGQNAANNEAGVSKESEETAEAGATLVLGSGDLVWLSLYAHALPFLRKWLALSW